MQIQASQYMEIEGVTYFQTAAAPDWCVAIHPIQLHKILSNPNRNEPVDVLLINLPEKSNG